MPGNVFMVNLLRFTMKLHPALSVKMKTGLGRQIEGTVKAKDAGKGQGIQSLEIL